MNFCIFDRMKKVLIVVVFTIILNNSFAQNWQWARGSSGSGFNSSEGTGVTIDKSGNTYITGEFISKSITFGTDTLINYDTSGNTNSTFLVKYDGLGNVLWVRGAGEIGGSAGSLSQCIVTDTSGNIYITGNFDSPTMTIGTYTLNNYTNGSNDIFLAKYNSAGNVLWAKNAGGGGADQCFSVVTEISGDVYITGRFDSPSVIFGMDTLINSNSVNGGDIFVVKYNAVGNVLWAKSIGGTKNDFGNSVATDVFGNVYVSGIFNSPSITA